MAISWYNARKECTKGEVRTKIVLLTSHCAIRYMLPGDCHGPKGPRNDTVVVGWAHHYYYCRQQLSCSIFDSKWAAAGAAAHFNNYSVGWLAASMI